MSQNMLKIFLRTKKCYFLILEEKNCFLRFQNLALHWKMIQKCTNWSEICLRTKIRKTGFSSSSNFDLIKNFEIFCTSQINVFWPYLDYRLCFVLCKYVLSSPEVEKAICLEFLLLKLLNFFDIGGPTKTSDWKFEFLSKFMINLINPHVCSNARSRDLDTISLRNNLEVKKKYRDLTWKNGERFLVILWKWITKNT